MGNFQVTLNSLTNRYGKSEDPIEKSNLLWEIINVKANCLQDYEGAEKDITAYIKSYPNGAWIESAYSKLGEIQYITGKYSKAIGTFRYHINLFKSSNMVENSIYTLANILRMDVKECEMASKWYSKLLKEYPSSKYYGNALFERAECFEKLNMHSKARNDYKKYLELFPDGHLKTLCLSRLSSHE
jgi:TolA-binding protein